MKKGELEQLRAVATAAQALVRYSHGMRCDKHGHSILKDGSRAGWFEVGEQQMRDLGAVLDAAGYPDTVRFDTTTGRPFSNQVIVPRSKADGVGLQMANSQMTPISTEDRTVP